MQILRKIRQKNKSQQGFTLIELLLYITIASVLLLSITLFFTYLVSIREKDRVIGWVDAAGIHAMDVLTRATRNATGIVSPLPGATSDTLVLESDGVTWTFFVSNWALVMEDQDEAQYQLTPDLAQATHFEVANYSNEETPGVVDVSFLFSLGDDNKNSRKEFFYEKRFFSSAALRP